MKPAEMFVSAEMFSRMRKCSRECGNVLVKPAEMFVGAEFAEMFSNVLVKPAERFP